MFRQSTLDAESHPLRRRRHQGQQFPLSPGLPERLTRTCRRKLADHRFLLERNPAWLLGPSCNHRSNHNSSRTNSNDSNRHRNSSD